MESIIESYFCNIFQSNNPSQADIGRVLEGVGNRLSATLSSFLDLDFTAEDIRRVVFDIGTLKAPGKDGFPALFFQRFWDKVGPSVTRACLECLNKGASMESMNETIITLIPKLKNSVRMSEFRPISLCNVIYKIIAKSIANRFRVVLDGVVSESQSAFILGRIISDNILIGFECMHRIKRRKRKYGSMAVKLDMSKAYDREEWSFVEQMMQRLGFSGKWIGLIHRCMASVSYSFVLNGEVFGNIKPMRGLRQGDPISPYLFLFCGEGFSSMLSSVVDSGVFKGFQCSHGGPIISHLLFVDDCLIFGAASVSNCLCL